MPVDVPPIVVEDLTKRYGATTAVDHLSFAVAPGQVTGFLGPNGSGKTTTMRAILGLIAPDRRHRAGLRGRRIASSPARRAGSVPCSTAPRPTRR